MIDAMKRASKNFPDVTQLFTKNIIQYHGRTIDPTSRTNQHIKAVKSYFELAKAFLNLELNMEQFKSFIGIVTAFGWGPVMCVFEHVMQVIGYKGGAAISHDEHIGSANDFGAESHSPTVSCFCYVNIFDCATSRMINRGPRSSYRPDVPGCIWYNTFSDND